jgi:hypothetical protein
MKEVDLEMLLEMLIAYPRHLAAQKGNLRQALRSCRRQSKLG